MNFNQLSRSFLALIAFALGGGLTVNDTLKAQEAAVPTGGISLYFAQPNDTLWDIAKRYRIQREQLIKLNPSLSDGEVEPGTGVVVWRREA